DEVTEEEVLTLGERAYVSIRGGEKEEGAGADVGDLLPVRRPCGDHIVARLSNDPDARAVARSQVQLRGDVEMRRAMRAGGSDRSFRDTRHRVPGRREHDLAACRREPWGLEIPPGALRFQEGSGVR